MRVGQHALDRAAADATTDAGRPRNASAAAGETDEEIAHVCGYTVPMIRAVLRSS